MLPLWGLSVREAGCIYMRFLRMEERVSDSGCSSKEEVGRLVKDFFNDESSIENVLSAIRRYSDHYVRKPPEYLYVQETLYSLLSKEETVDKVVDFWIAHALTDDKQFYMCGLLWVQEFQGTIDKVRLDIFISGCLGTIIGAEFAQRSKYVQEIWVRVIACMLIRTTNREEMTEILIKANFLERMLQSMDDEAGSLAKSFAAILYYMLLSGGDPEKIHQVRRRLKEEQETNGQGDEMLGKLLDGIDQLLSVSH
jgi:hypothetical protein